jgi:hypothetical protein
MRVRSNNAGSLAADADADAHAQSSSEEASASHISDQRASPSALRFSAWPSAAAAACAKALAGTQKGAAAVGAAWCGAVKSWW